MLLVGPTAIDVDAVPAPAVLSTATAEFVVIRPNVLNNTNVIL